MYNFKTFITTLALRIIPGIMTIAMLGGCSGGESRNDEIALARQAIDAADYSLAFTTLERIWTAPDSVSSPTMLAEMAVMYMMVNDNIADSNSDLRAIECFRRAVKISPDSVAAVFATLPPDEAQYLFLLKMLTGSIDNVSTADFGEYENSEYGAEGDFPVDETSSISD